MSIGIEITYAPQNGEVPSDLQYAALHDLVAELYGFYGALPVVGHGEVDLSRWPTEPHALDWTRAGFGPRTANGRYLLPAEEDDMACQEALAAMTVDRDRLQGLFDERGRQIDALRAEMAQKDSTIGALTHDVVEPLRAQVEQLSRALDLAGHRSAREVLVTYDDGTALRFTPQQGG